MLSARRRLRRSSRASRPERGSSGFTIVELLLACVIGSLALAAAWSWLFTSAAAGGREQRRLETETSLAFVERLTAAELRRASLFLASPTPGCSAQSVLFVVADDEGATETISYVWSPSTRVLWRKATGSHLVSGVLDFTITYFDGTGAEVASTGGALTAAELSRVRRLRLAIALACGTREMGASWDVTPRAER
jgi:Tfp pilus assembly protein PilW